MDRFDLLVAHAALTWLLAGLIWVVQLVHYPLFELAERGRFAAFEARHAARITWIVAPAMGGELLTGAVLLLLPPPGVSRGLLGAAFALLLVNALSTALLQVPCHRTLARGFDAGAHARLVRSNWIRTAAWSARALLVAQALRLAAA